MADGPTIVLAAQVPLVIPVEIPPLLVEIPIPSGYHFRQLGSVGVWLPDSVDDSGFAWPQPAPQSVSAPVQMPTSGEAVRYRVRYSFGSRTANPNIALDAADHLSGALVQDHSAPDWDLVKTLVELAREGKDAEFRELAGMANGALSAKDIAGMLEGTRRRLAKNKPVDLDVDGS